jgi:DNA-binding response OmpR family regulator
MSTVWLVGAPDQWLDEFAETLAGFFGIRRIAGLVNFSRLISISDLDVDICSHCIVRLLPNDPVMTIHASISRFLRECSPAKICVVGDVTPEQVVLLEGLGIAMLGTPTDMILTAKMIRSLIRPGSAPSRMGSSSEVIRFGDIEVDAAASRLRILATGVDEALTPKEVRIIRVLASAMNRAVPRDELMEKVWTGLKVSDSTIDSHMSRLRKKFDHSFECHLETRYGSGWVLTVNGASIR